SPEPAAACGGGDCGRNLRTVYSLEYACCAGRMGFRYLDLAIYGEGCTVDQSVYVRDGGSRPGAVFLCGNLAESSGAFVASPFGKLLGRHDGLRREHLVFPRNGADQSGTAKSVDGSSGY